MKKMLALAVLASVLVSGRALGAEKIVFVDVQEVFKRFYKTQLAQDQVRQQADDIRVEMDAMEAEVADMKEEIELLRKDARDATLGEEVQASKLNELEEKLVLLQHKEQEIGEFEKARNEQIKQQNQRMSIKLFDEIQEAIILFSKEQGYDAVIDRSALNRSGKQTVLFVNSQMDITADVLANLNKGSEEYMVTDEPASEKE